MQDRTIDNALLALRKQMILGDQHGLDHVEALCRLRDVATPRVVHKPARRGEMARLVLVALKQGPMSRKDIVACVAEKRPDIPPDRVYWRTDAALSKLRAKAFIRRGGRLWRLAQ